jgi:hypothetical protein
MPAPLPLRWTKLAQAHLEELADRHGVTIDWCVRWQQAEAWGKEVTIPRVQRPVDYLVGLHELGHCLQLQSKRLHNRADSDGQLARESWAWAWAVKHIDPDLASAITKNQWVQAMGRTYGAYVQYHATYGHPDWKSPGVA